MKLKNVKKKFKRRWTLKREIRAQEDILESLGTNHHLYGPALDSIKTCTEIRARRAETRAKVFQAVGTVGLTALALFAAYKVDKSDDLLRNKQSLGVFNKIFKS